MCCSTTLKNNTSSTYLHFAIVVLRNIQGSMKYLTGNEIRIINNVESEIEDFSDNEETDRTSTSLLPAEKPLNYFSKHFPEEHFEQAALYTNMYTCLLYTSFDSV